MKLDVYNVDCGIAFTIYSANNQIIRLLIEDVNIDGEKNPKSNVINNLINIHFNC